MPPKPTGPLKAALLTNGDAALAKGKTADNIPFPDCLYFLLFILGC